MEHIWVHISDRSLSLDEAYDFVLDESCGGNCLFIGTARNQNQGETVTHLDFETYEKMALSEMRGIAEECIQRFGVRKVAILHRSGEVRQKEKAVIIAVSGVHRAECFDACRHAIDRLKERVPIWKKEFLLDGSHWVSERP
ncbi:MAG: molybdenum cofactor biosynthesis protein MoaE [Flavobacteriales bacterium]|nr:molybdenum cofactor biosynthesis protein MoaE [Flavobacteriales bacterium]